MEHAPRSSPAGRAAATAVVCCPRGSSVPPDLRDALDKGGIRVIEAASAYAALAELCRLDRGLRTTPDRGKAAAPALLLVTPERFEGAEALLQAVERYAATAKLWMFGPAGAERLRAITSEDRRTQFGASPSHAQKLRESMPSSAGSVPVAIAQPKAPEGPSVGRFMPAGTWSTVPPLRVTPSGGGLAGGPGRHRVMLKVRPDPIAGGVPGGVLGPSGVPAAPAEPRTREKPLLTTEELRMLLEEDASR